MNDAVAVFDAVCFAVYSKKDSYRFIDSVGASGKIVFAPLFDAGDFDRFEFFGHIACSIGSALRASGISDGSICSARSPPLVSPAT